MHAEQILCCMAQMIILTSLMICLVSYVIIELYGNNLNSQLKKIFLKNTKCAHFVASIIPVPEFLLILHQCWCSDVKYHTALFQRDTENLTCPRTCRKGFNKDRNFNSLGIQSES